jgi:hypothetical protein
MAYAQMPGIGHNPHHSQTFALKSSQSSLYSQQVERGSTKEGFEMQRLGRPSTAIARPNSFSSVASKSISGRRFSRSRRGKCGEGLLWPATISDMFLGQWHLSLCLISVKRDSIFPYKEPSSNSASLVSHFLLLPPPSLTIYCFHFKLRNYVFFRLDPPN